MAKEFRHPLLSLQTQTVVTFLPQPEADLANQHKAALISLRSPHRSNRMSRSLQSTPALMSQDPQDCNQINLDQALLVYNNKDLLLNQMPILPVNFIDFQKLLRDHHLHLTRNSILHFQTTEDFFLLLIPAVLDFMLAVKTETILVLVHKDPQEILKIDRTHLTDSHDLSVSIYYFLSGKIFLFLTLISLYHSLV